MKRLWKRFTAWLYYLRHPCTIITMQDAPAKGVQVNLTYIGEYEEKAQKDLSIFKKPLEYSAHFEGKITDPNFLRDLFEPPKEQSPNMLHIQINRLDGSCPVQASGTIEDHSAFYFRGRHEQWQFVAGPKELNTNGLVKVQLKLTQDSRVFVLEGDDEERMYLDYDHVRRCLQTYAQQYVEWMNERRDTNEQEDKEEH